MSSLAIAGENMETSDAEDEASEAQGNEIITLDSPERKKRGRPVTTGDYERKKKEMERKAKKKAAEHDLRFCKNVSDSETMAKQTRIKAGMKSKEETIKEFKVIPTLAISAQVIEEANIVDKVADVSKRLKGNLARSLRVAAVKITAAIAVVSARAREKGISAAPEEVAKLRAEVERMKMERDGLREKLDKYKSEPSRETYEREVTLMGPPSAVDRGKDRDLTSKRKRPNRITNDDDDEELPPLPMFPPLPSLPRERSPRTRRNEEEKRRILPQRSSKSLLTPATKTQSASEMASYGFPLREKPSGQEEGKEEARRAVKEIDTLIVSLMEDKKRILETFGLGPRIKEIENVQLNVKILLKGVQLKEGRKEGKKEKRKKEGGKEKTVGKEKIVNPPILVSKGAMAKSSNPTKKGRAEGVH